MSMREGETVAGRRENRGLWRNSSPTMTPAACLPLKRLCREATEKALKLWAGEESLANAFLNKVEHRSVAGQLHFKLFHSSIKQTALTSV